MYTLYFKIAFRYLLKNRQYAFINILGLSIGLASFILLMSYVNYEKSYDQFENSENVYRVYMDYLEGGNFVPSDAQTYNAAGPIFKKEFPEVEEFVRLYRFDKVTFTYGNRVLEEKKGSLADASYFDVFRYQLESGNPKTVLKDPNTIVITKSFAQKLFGDEDPIGKTVFAFYARDRASFTVTGVMQDIPDNSHAKTRFLISYASIHTWSPFRNQRKLNWNMNNYYTYLKLNSQADADLLRKKMQESNFENDKDERHNIEPLESIHLESHKPFEMEANGSISRVRFLWSIAVIILVLCWLNYINLSTSKSLERAKETGIRKVAGAQQGQLIVQSLLESLVLNVIALLIALTLVISLLPIFNQYVGKEITLIIADTSFIFSLLGIILMGALLSGVYPAFVMSRFTPITALKGKMHVATKKFTIRQGLITLQFLATIVLLIGTIVVTRQVKFIQEQPIGADLSQVVTVQGEVLTQKEDSLVIKDFQLLARELGKLPFVSAATTAQTFPGEGYENFPSFTGVTYPNGTEDGDNIYYTYVAQAGYFDLLDIKLLAGKSFPVNAEGKSRSIVINEKMARMMGYGDVSESVGEITNFWGIDWKIVGVMENYHHFDLKNNVVPLAVRHNNDNTNMLIKLDEAAAATNIGQAIAQIRSTWEGIFPQSTFNYSFVNQIFQAQYEADNQFSDAFFIFTLLAIGIAAMGLFGLTSYACIQRRKEIGIRKVNGANVKEILILLNKDFVKWVFLAFVLAVPLSWYVMHQWLENFAYKTPINWWVYVLAGVVALTIAVFTISLQSYKAAIVNPVESLKDE